MGVALFLVEHLPSGRISHLKENAMDRLGRAGFHIQRPAATGFRIVGKRQTIPRQHGRPHSVQPATANPILDAVSIKVSKIQIAAVGEISRRDHAFAVAGFSAGEGGLGEHDTNPQRVSARELEKKQVALSSFPPRKTKEAGTRAMILAQ